MSLAFERSLLSKISRGIPSDCKFRLSKGILDYHDLDNAAVALVGSPECLSFVKESFHLVSTEGRAEDQATAAHVWSLDQTFAGQFPQEIDKPKAIHFHLECFRGCFDGQQSAFAEVLERYPERPAELSVLVTATNYPEKISYGLPGGKRELGETEWNCLVRETREEATLDLLALPPPVVQVGCVRIRSGINIYVIFLNKE